MDDKDCEGDFSSSVTLSPCHLVTLSPCHLVFLIGPRGSGKSTVAQLLAARLGWKWLDADAELERRWGRSIRDIFMADGEAAFRDMENAVLADLCQLREHVIATGGGVVVRPENRERLRSSGRVVWLTAQPATLAARLQEDATTTERRPALTGTGTPSSLREISAVLALREPLYRSCADVVATTEGRAPEIIAEELFRWWQSEPPACEPPACEPPACEPPA